MAPKRKWRKNSGRGVKGSALREIRVETSSDDDSDFIGFIEYDTQDNKKFTEKTVSVLHREQSVLDEYNVAGPSTDGLVPKPAPYEYGDTEIVKVSDENDPLLSEFPQDILWSIPDPQEESSDETSSDEVKYRIREAGTAQGNPCIESSDGYTYSHQKYSKGKSDPPKYRYFKCIKRQTGNKNNCNARLKIERYEDGDGRMIVERRGPQHNHDQGFWNFIRKDINSELKRMAVGCC